MTTRIKLRRDTATNWASSNPVLALGEPGLETDTRKVKYGDGVTAWNNLQYSADSATSDVVSDWTDGLNDNVWRMVTVSGQKQFEFVTEGWALLEYTFPSTQENLTELVLSVDDYPAVADIWWNYETAQNTVNIYQGQAQSGNVMAAGLSSYTNGNLTIGMDGYTFNQGDKLTIKYYTEGTTSNSPYYNTYGTWIPDQTENGLVNTIQIDSNEFNSNIELILTNVSKHAITFNNWDRTESRNITAVTNDAGVYTITFDGDPRPIRTLTLANVTTEARSSGVDSTQYLEIDFSAIENYDRINRFGWDSTETNKYTGGVQRSGYVIINGGEPVDFRYYEGVNSDTKAYQLELLTPSTWNEGDTVQVFYYTWLDKIELEIYNPDANDWVNGYRWFDFKADMPEYHAIPTNGITGGTGRVMSKVYDIEINDDDYAQWTFAWYGNDNDNEVDPYDPYKQTQIWNADSENMPFYYFSEDHGCIFRCDWQRWSGSWSRKLKVRILYKFEFNITGEDPSEWWC